jgi:hypothetical protein
MLKWPGSKRHEDFAKAIPQVMSDLARTAIERLRIATAEAREIAAWYERNPNSLYLPPDCSELRGKKLTAEDLARITGLRRDSVLELFKTKKLVPNLAHAASGHRIYTFNFEDVEAFILTLLPNGFPIADPSNGMRYSELLTVVRRNEFGEVGTGAWRCMIAPLKYTNIQGNFNNPHNKGIFFRLGLCSEEEPISIKTHQLRAYLNTLAQTGGLSEVEIAAWSGRKDIRQNRAYDHRKPEDVLTAIMRRRKKSSATSLAVRVNEPVSRSLELGSENHGHITELGFCEHDFSSSPCTMFMDCLNCTKHVCIKGVDPRHLERIDQSLIHAARNLQEAQRAVEQEFDGAAEWVVAHKETISRLEQLRAILMDSSIADGSVIRLSKSGRYSAVEQAMYDQGLLTLNNEVSHSPMVSGALGSYK